VLLSSTAVYAFSDTTPFILLSTAKYDVIPPDHLPASLFIH
jgi:hypothetical protein